MTKRPISITILSWLFIAIGTIGFIRSVAPLVDMDSAQRVTDLKAHWIVWFLRLVSVIAGIFTLRGFNWARWLLVVWMASHVIIGAMHSVFQLVVHALFFGAIVYILFRTAASEYFRRPHPVST